MIKINNITRGRFGNRILQYNTAFQLSKTLKTEMFCSKWEGYELFENLHTDQKTEKNPEFLYSWSKLLSHTTEEMLLFHSERDLVIDDPAYTLHNVFYKVTNIAPRHFLKIKDELKPKFSNNIVVVGLHIRGGDIIFQDGNGGREIHSTKYYIDAIQEVENDIGTDKEVVFCVCTDDLGFITFRETVNYLSQTGRSWCLGPATKNPSTTKHFLDFSLLSECDYLIASSSTYAICAGFLGKEKKIVHSLEWIEKNINHTLWHKDKKDDERTRAQQISFDNFWIKVYNGGNEFYKAWRIV